MSLPAGPTPPPAWPPDTHLPQAQLSHEALTRQPGAGAALAVALPQVPPASTTNRAGSNTREKKTGGQWRRRWRHWRRQWRWRQRWRPQLSCVMPASAASCGHAVPTAPYRHPWSKGAASQRGMQTHMASLMGNGSSCSVSDPPSSLPEPAWGGCCAQRSSRRPSPLCPLLCPLGIPSRWSETIQKSSRRWCRACRACRRTLSARVGVPPGADVSAAGACC